MPLVKVGLDAVHHGKKLFPLLCNLKNFGKGRIIYSTLEQQFPEPSFYRILLAQPEMDEEMQFGRIVAERVYRGVKFDAPFNMAGKQTKFPDYRLVPKDEEDMFCRWNEVEDYQASKHAPKRAAHMEMPPLLRLVMERSRTSRGESTAEKDFLLPAHKIYKEGDYYVDESREPESNDMSLHLEDQFKTHLKHDIMSLIPYQEWHLDRHRSMVGHRMYPSYSEEVEYGWEELQRREAEAAEKKSRKE